MLTYTVSRSIQIDKSPTEVIDYLSDFTTWPKWSPWLIMEPNCRVEFSSFQQQPGAVYGWDGRLVGEGRIELEHLTDERIDAVIEFKRPFKSRAKVAFVVSNQAGMTEVEWIMRGKLPWYLFFLKRFFQSMIGMDYERGLRMLKSQLETGSVFSILEDIGQGEWPQTHYIGLKGAGTLDTLGPLMQRQISELKQYANSKQVAVQGELFCYYRSMKMSTGRFEFITCLPTEKPLKVKSPFVSGTIDACPVYKVLHTGEYQFLGNGWSFLMMVSRHNKIKIKTRPLGIERYLNSPDNTPDMDLMTEIIAFRR